MNARENKTGEVLVEHLTRREREILVLLAQGYSAPEIAQQLTLALSSVKWYVQQVYGKLGVNRRHQALVRAAELGLLAPSATPQAPTPEPLPSLPLQLTSFIGREKAIAEVRRLVSQEIGRAHV